MESDSIRDKIESTPIHKPLFVAGLARAGSTIILEMIAEHADVATHQCRDFMTMFTPYWFARAVRRSSHKRKVAVERSHGDRILVTPESPEAMEEILWMSFFRGLHDPSRNNVLDATTRNKKFARFYRDHIRKLLLTRQKSRYASKGNYNTTRLQYIASLFPDARFIVPIRSPRHHIASLRKQHELLLMAARRHPRSVGYLDRLGHFEFGAHRRPIHTGDDHSIQSIVQCWKSGDEVRGWARYWSTVYGYVADLLEEDAHFSRMAKIVRYEDLCDNSKAELFSLFEHCDLPNASPIIESYCDSLSQPSYYEPRFTEAEEKTIVEETSDVAARFGYDAAAGTDPVHPSSTDRLVPAGLGR